MKLLSTLNSVFSKLNISRINYWKHVLASMVITFAVPASAKTYEVLNATCHFSSAWTYQFDDDTVGTYSVINQSMSVKDGRLLRVSALNGVRSSVIVTTATCEKFDK